MKIINAETGKTLDVPTSSGSRPGILGSRDELNFFTVICATGDIPRVYRKILSDEESRKKEMESFGDAYKPVASPDLLRWIYYVSEQTARRNTVKLFFPNEARYRALKASGTW